MSGTKVLCLFCVKLTMAAVACSPSLLWAGGFKGGGAAPQRGGGAGVSHLGAARPNVGNAAASRPQINAPSNKMPAANKMPTANRPAINTPAVNRPATPNVTLPSARPNVQLPQVNSRPGRPGNEFSGSPSPANRLPNVNRPASLPGQLPNNVTGGLKPATPKPVPSPSPMPSTRPSLPNPPSVSAKPNLPSAKPNFPSANLGNNRLPNNKLPEGLGGDKFPIGGGNRLPPSLPSTLPAQLPNKRPSGGDIGDFLGIGSVRPLTPEAPIRPGRPDISTRPSLPSRPDIPARPNLPSRPEISTRPSLPTQPVRPQRPPLEISDIGGGILGGNNRPINIGQINVQNNLNINNSLNWANIDNNRFGVIQNQWSNQLGGLYGWGTRYPARVGYWNGWANGVRVGWYGHHLHNNWFSGDWWYNHPGGFCRWHYYHRFDYYPWSYWWRRPSWTVFDKWFAWSASAATWAQPVFYDYGAGGNVTYENNYVFVNGQQVATTAEFSQSAAMLATVAPPANDQEAMEAEWLPLGVFAISTRETDTSPNRVVQLAINKQGIVAGTLYNYDTDQAIAVQGQVDRETQRVAMRLGDQENVIVETGLYNLTQDECPVLVHFRTEKMEEYLLVRLESEQE
jgi:hypothetical protein